MPCPGCFTTGKETLYTPYWTLDGPEGQVPKILTLSGFDPKIIQLLAGHYTNHGIPVHLLTYLLTPWCRVLLEKLTGLQLVKKLPAFHGTQRFITALTSVRQLSLFWASQIQSLYIHPTSRRFILILSAHLHLGLPSGLLPSSFPTKTLYTPLSTPICATCPGHLILLDFITRTILGEEYKSFSSSLYNLLHSPITSSLLGPNIFLNTLFSNTLSFLSSRSVNNIYLKIGWLSLPQASTCRRICM